MEDALAFSGLGLEMLDVLLRTRQTHKTKELFCKLNETFDVL